jgi:hypothetical protein
MDLRLKLKAGFFSRIIKTTQKGSSCPELRFREQIKAKHFSSLYLRSWNTLEEDGGGYEGGRRRRISRI